VEAAFYKEVAPLLIAHHPHVAIAHPLAVHSNPTTGGIVVVLVLVVVVIYIKGATTPP